MTRGRGKRGWLRDPLALRRAGIVAIGSAAILAGLAAILRDRARAGTPSHSATYLLDVAGWLIALAGAVAEARVGDLLLAAGSRGARRRAIGFTVAGLGAALVACVTIPGQSSDALGALPRAVLAAALVGGFGVGLGGLATLGWHYGGRYAANRIERMGEEDW